MIEKSCKQCGKIFEVKLCEKERAKFCSLKCRYESMKGNTLRKITRVKKTCPLCNKTFEVKKSHASKRKFCSQKCYDIVRMRDAEIKICPVCNKRFRVKASEKKIRKHCSTKCAYEARKGTNFHVLIPKIKRECQGCGKKIEMFPCRIKDGKGKFCSKECYTKYAVGKNHSNWQDGKSFEPYSPNWTETLRGAIRQRDCYVCQECDKTQEENGRKLDVHHIDYDKKNCDPKNLISLCHICHLKVNHNREYWQQYFQNLNYVSTKFEI